MCDQSVHVERKGNSEVGEGRVSQSFPRYRYRVLVSNPLAICYLEPKFSLMLFIFNLLNS